jgi:hypothetical protein
MRRLTHLLGYLAAALAQSDRDADAGFCRRRPLSAGFTGEAEGSHHGSAQAEPDFTRRWAVQGSNLRPWD